MDDDEPTAFSFTPELPSSDLTIDGSKLSLSLGDPSAMLLINSETTVKFLQPEVHVCAKGHEEKGVDVRWCHACVEEWFTSTFPMTRKSS